jgi:hypothetical protein
VSTNATDRTTADHFAELAARWRADTEFLSAPDEIADHPAYREIIAMGEPAIRLILAELDSRPDSWFEALRALTGEDPVPHGARGNVRAMAEAWREWGRQEEAARAEALRLAPSNARLMAGIARRLAGQGPRIEGDFGDDEEMPY